MKHDDMKLINNPAGIADRMDSCGMNQNVTVSDY